MNRNLFILASSALFAAMPVQFVRGQGVITVVEDFEGELPGTQLYPGGYSFSGGEMAGGGSAPPTVIEEVTESGGFNSLQAFQTTIDSTVNAGSYFYYGMGGFFGFFGEGFGFAQGQAGADDLANYEMSFDLKVLGNDGGDAATPVGGSFAAYDSDYETANNIDLNNDGDMADGFDVWKTTFTVASAGPDYSHVTWRLDQGTAPTADPLITTPTFSDETTFAFQIYFNSGGFGTDAGNVVTIDNVQMTFTPPTEEPGDFNDDGVVDGADFLAWQRGESPNQLSVADLDLWKANFGVPAAIAVSAIPEPTAALLAACGLAAMAAARRIAPERLVNRQC
jgi:hypothetical protein